MEWSGVHPVLGAVLKKLPKVPSLVPIYKVTLTTTTDETTTTFTGVDIGLPHPKRVVVLCILGGVSNSNATSRVNGYDQYFTTGGGTSLTSNITAHIVPNDTTATIEVTRTTSARKAVSVYVFYPENPIPLDSSAAPANTTVDANLVKLKVQAGGCLIYAGSQLATLGTFTTTWDGTDGVVEDVDAQLEATSSYTAGHINVTVSTDNSNLNLAESVSGTKCLAAVTFGPPYSGAYPTTV